ncbi:MAG: hypothetical protein DDT26_02248 [Dehalococcoidia bacterium]|nr:hypothetical protein [Chloroflexota bacterium]
MLHSGLVVYHHIVIITCQLVQNMTKHVVYGAVATLTFGAPHSNKVEADGFHQSLEYPGIKPCLLIEPRGKLPQGDLLFHKLPDTTDGIGRIVEGKTQRQMQIGGRVAVNR